MTGTRKMTLLVSDKKKEIYYAGNPDIVKKYPVIGVLASGKAPEPVVWDSYHLFYALRDSDVTIAGGWHSPLEKGILDALIEGKVNIALFAAKGLEKLLKLVRKLQRKLSQINDTVGLDSSVIGEVADPKTFNTLNRIAGEDHTIIEELEAFSELAGNELMKQQLSQFLKSYSASQIESIPFGIHSGKDRGDLGSGIFFYYKAEDNHFWRFYDVGYNRILDNRLDIFRRIYCKPDTPRIEADIDIYEIKEKVKEAISEDTKAKRAAMMAPKKLDKVQSDLIAILREGVAHRKVDKASAYDIIKILNLPMTSAFIKDLKTVRDLFNNDKNYFELQESLKVFSSQFESSVKVEEEKEPESKSYAPEDLELICYMTLSGQ
ncbi:MAG: hypothetical protein OCU18_07525 [Candidatus Syntrophoarchaeum sp.]|nr:hypothetical protein [Candidatus Syntrophoarchaeum sp.]